MSEDFFPTWLMIKRHSVTGLKYFCKTTKADPYKYKGSGVRWVRHLKKHGRFVETDWCELFTDRKALIEYAIAFSIENDIVKSTDWANLVIEDGITGWPTGTKHTIETIEKCRKNAKGFKKEHIPHNAGKKNSKTHYEHQLAGMKRFRETNIDVYNKTLENLKPTPYREYRRKLAIKNKLSGSGNTNFDPTLYYFKNKKTGELIQTTRNELIHNYDCRAQNVYKVIKGNRKSVNGWYLV